MPLLAGSSVFARCSTTCLSNSIGCAQGKVLLLCAQLASVSHTHTKDKWHLSLLPLPCTFLHDSDLDYTTDLVQEW